MINLTMKLFQCVLAKDNTSQARVFFSEGIVISKEAVWAEPQILEYYKNSFLNGDDLNKTFHKSWKKILESSREELLLDQLKHYFSTYGTGFEGEMYIPEEVLSLPEGSNSLTFKVINGVSKETLIKKCLDMLSSGIAMSKETIEDVLNLLSLLGHTFDSIEGIANKEASILISDKYGIYPTDNLSAMRYCLYKSTGETLLIKSKETIEAIKESNFDPSVVFNTVGLVEMSKIFNRFKPLFLAYKNMCPKVVNKISKLSKKHHSPLVVNPLNMVTSLELQECDLHWLENATIYSLFKALNALSTRLGGQEDFVYRVRNGKSWTKNGKGDNRVLLSKNLEFILY